MEERRAPEPLDELQAELFGLLNRYSSEPCCCTAGRIASQLEHILRHPLIGLFPELQLQYARCLNNWRARAWFSPAAGAPAPRALH